MTLHVFFWLFSGLLAARTSARVWQSDFRHSPRIGLGVSFGFVIVAVGVVGIAFLSFGRFAADVTYARALRGYTAPEQLDATITSVARATQYNPYTDTYYRVLSLLLQQKAGTVISEIGDKKPTQEQSDLLRGLVAQIESSVIAATALEPYQVGNWVSRGQFYRDLMAYVPVGAQDGAVQAFVNAAALEPKNPSHHTNVGRVFLALADRAHALKTSEDKKTAEEATKAENDNLNAAQKEFELAADLKPEYAPAQYFLGATYERQGRMDDAVKRLVTVTRVNPQDVGAGMELSQLYLRLKKWDEAGRELERLLSINDKNSNAMWYLASVYELKKQPEKALELIKKVADLNPDNEAVKKRLKMLKNGEVTTTIPEPVDESSSVVTPQPVSPTNEMVNP